KPEKILKALFEHAFRIAKPGLIDLPGTYDQRSPPSLELRTAWQSALKKTFLQHGKSTKKVGAPQTRSFDLDGRQVSVTFQPYSSYAHQEAWKLVAKGLSEPIELAGWAYPGAVQRHVAFSETRFEYDAAT